MKSVVSSVGTKTGTPPASCTDSGYVVQYGAMTRTSSPGSRRVANAFARACLAPFVTSTWAGVTEKPESRRVLFAIASRNAGRPAVGE